MTRSRAAIFLLALGPWGAISACGDDQTTDVVEPPSPPLTTGTTTGASSGSTGPTGEPRVCGLAGSGTATDTGADGGTTTATGSAGTEDGSDPSGGCFCVGDFIAGGEPPQTFLCQTECIPSGAVGQWCWDDESCCDAPCRPDGFCGEPVIPGDSTSGDTDGSSSGTMGSSSETGSGSSSDSGSSSGSGESSSGGSGSSTG